MARARGNRQARRTVAGATRRLVISIAMVVVVVGCAPTSSALSSPLSSPSAAASPEVVCDGSQFQPPPSLTCGPAIAAALGMLALGHPPIIREEFRWVAYVHPAHPALPHLGTPGSSSSISRTALRCSST